MPKYTIMKNNCFHCGRIFLVAYLSSLSLFLKKFQYLKKSSGIVLGGQGYLCPYLNYWGHVPPATAPGELVSGAQPMRDYISSTLMSSILWGWINQKFLRFYRHASRALIRRFDVSSSSSSI